MKQLAAEWGQPGHTPARLAAASDNLRSPLPPITSLGPGQHWLRSRAAGGDTGWVGEPGRSQAAPSAAPRSHQLIHPFFLFFSFPLSHPPLPKREIVPHTCAARWGNFGRQSTRIFHARDASAPYLGKIIHTQRH